jgi:hypothetical protein
MAFFRDARFCVYVSDKESKNLPPPHTGISPDNEYEYVTSHMGDSGTGANVLLIAVIWQFRAYRPTPTHRMRTAGQAAQTKLLIVHAGN